MIDTNRTEWKNVVLTALITGFIAFWGGIALSNYQSDAVATDHEGRIRRVEEAVIYLRTLVEERDVKR